MKVKTGGKTKLPENGKSSLAQANEAFRVGNKVRALELYNQAKSELPEFSDLIDFNISLALGDVFSGGLGQAEIDQQKECSLYKDAVTVDIVIPVYNALEDVKRCLDAIDRNSDGFHVTAYVVDDCSGEDTTKWLRDFCLNRTNFVLTENEANLGYTPTVNIGLKQCSSDYVVTLNSDTIVTRGWLQSIVRCFKSDNSIGVVGPLSNAASWQNVPDLLDESKQFAVNMLPANWSPDDMSILVQKASRRTYPKVPFVNGFCFVISRKAFETVGFLDEKTFPTGYGEENDYCMRVSEAGFFLAVCDDSYVFHAKSKSFGHEKRKKLSKIGSDALKLKHGKEKIDALSKKVREMTDLDEIRDRVRSALKKELEAGFDNPLLKRVLFLLPVSGGGGGVHSIVQETMGMRRLGVRAKIAVPEKHRHKFIEKYRDIDLVEDLFVGFVQRELVGLSKNFDVVVGTIYTSMKLVREIVCENPAIIPAYYIQDYEPLFSKPGTPEWKEARDSYTLISGATLFAKTDWICDKVYEEHGVYVHKVCPSIDHEVYKPDPFAKGKAGLEGKIVVSAMIRPKTPRRGAERTMKVLRELSEKFGNELVIEIFGSAEDDPLFRELDRGFKYTNHGELSRMGVATVLQASDCFVDLSDYQAFGRTGLEAMACGATVVITKFGGVYEYAKPGWNSLVVDPFREDLSDEVSAFLADGASLNVMKMRCLLTAADYSVNRASISEMGIF